MKTLMALVILTASSMSFAQHRPPREFPASCQDRDLVSNRGRVLFQFSFSSECKTALAQAKSTQGRFCADGELHRGNGSFVHAFTFRSGCIDALNQLRGSRTGLFCDSDRLLQVRTGHLFYMNFSSTCREAVADAKLYNGLFCKDGWMYNQWGQALRNYTFNSSCKQALPEISGQGNFEFANSPVSSWRTKQLK